MKKAEEVMEILEAFDLAGTLRGAAELTGCDHKTVAHWVAAREEAGGGLPVSVRPRPAVDPFAVKIEEWVDRSRGKIRATGRMSALSRWATWARSARPAARSLGPSAPGGRATAGAPGRG